MRLQQMGGVLSSTIVYCHCFCGWGGLYGIKGARVCVSGALGPLGVCANCALIDGRGLGSWLHGADPLASC